MKHILLLSILFSSTGLYAQNVGIGTDAPTEKLHVNGNVNITGTIKANGVAGKSGQVLMSSATGLTWGSMMNYKNCVMIYTPGSGTWTVPAGVTEIMVEVWGAGSGGTEKSGGTSGGYARSIQTVSPGYAMAYTVGLGSGYGSVSTVDGGTSQVTFPLGFMQAYGGNGVTANQRGSARSGGAAPGVNAYVMPGNAGEGTTWTYGQKTATIFVEVVRYGSGGAPIGMINATPVEGDILRYENGTQVYQMNGNNSLLPSAGGASGVGSGWSGAHGLIVIWYN